MSRVEKFFSSLLKVQVLREANVTLVVWQMCRHFLLTNSTVSISRCEEPIRPSSQVPWTLSTNKIPTFCCCFLFYENNIQHSKHMHPLVRSFSSFPPGCSCSVWKTTLSFLPLLCWFHCSNAAVFERRNKLPGSFIGAPPSRVIF